MIEYIQGLWSNRYVLGNLVSMDLATKYRRSILGVAWSVLTPLGLALIMGSVYSIIFGADPKIFIPTLFTGLNPWIFINSAADSGTFAFIAAEGYLKQTSVKAQVFPARVVLVSFINLLYSLIAFIIIYVFLRPEVFSFRMFMAIPGLIIGFFFALGWANIASVIHLNVRDFQPFQALMMQGLFYLTPILYAPEMLKDRGYEIAYLLNPVYYIIEVIRRPLLGERLPTLQEYIVAIAVSLTLFLISVYLIMKHKRTIAFKL